MLRHTPASRADLALQVPRKEAKYRTDEFPMAQKDAGEWVRGRLPRALQLLEKKDVPYLPDRDEPLHSTLLHRSPTRDSLSASPDPR